MKICRWPALLAVAAVSACTNVEGLYDRAALEGANANVEGIWVSNSPPCQMINFTQKGDEVTGWWCDFEGVWLNIKGSVKGRVVKGGVDGDYYGAICGLPGAGFLFVLTVPATPGPAPFALNVVDGGGGSAGVIQNTMVQHRNEDARSGIPNSPYVQGLTILPVPVTREGAVTGITSQASCVRTGLASLFYTRNLQGTLVASRMLTAVESPRKAVRINYPGPGHFSKTLDRGTFINNRKTNPKFRARESTLDGRRCWWVLAPTWEAGSSDTVPGIINGELYYDDPYGASGPMPVESVEVARRKPGGPWKSVESVMMVGETLRFARGVLAEGEPDGVEAFEPEAPSIEPFLVAKEGSIAQARWRTRALVSVKNRTLPKLLADAKTSELTSLAERVEQLLLDVNHEGELARDRAQHLVETNSGSPDEMREMSLVYKERLEVLKPIIVALKEEIANRNR